MMDNHENKPNNIDWKFWIGNVGVPIAVAIITTLAAGG